MPCSTEHLQPREHEIHAKEAAMVYVWVCEKIGQFPPVGAKEASEDLYGDNKDFRHPVSSLCTLFKFLGEEKIQRLVANNLSDKTAILAMGWWHKHKEIDEAKKRGEKDFVPRRYGRGGLF